MLRELFRIPLLDLPIYGYGLMLAVAVLAAAELAKRRARRRGLDGELFVNAALIAIFSGIVGARLSHVLENFSAYTDPQRSALQNLWAAVNIHAGGLTYYGGFLLALPTVIAYAVWKKIPIRVGMDIVAPSIVLGLALGRIGCLLNGCCWGQVCDQPWALRFPYDSPPYVDHAERGWIETPTELLRDGELTPYSKAMASPILRPLAERQRSLPVHPTQIYSFVAALLVMAAVLAFDRLPHAPGRAFALMLMLEGASRFTIELLRIEPEVLPGMSISMVIGAGVVVLGAGMWAVFRGAASPAPA